MWLSYTNYLNLSSLFCRCLDKQRLQLFTLPWKLFFSRCHLCSVFNSILDLKYTLTMKNICLAGKWVVYQSPVCHLHTNVISVVVVLKCISAIGYVCVCFGVLLTVHLSVGEWLKLYTDSQSLMYRNFVDRLR